jgi:xanthine dehydrogenase accessory factor
MSHETLELIDALRRSGRRAAMATLVRTVGTTPRKEGTKMFVDTNGDIFGSVTIGGCVDSRVIEESSAVLSSSAPRILAFDLGDNEAWELGLTCGGKVEVLMEPVTDEILETYDAARRELDAGKAVAIATDLQTGTHSIAPIGSRSADGTYVEVLQPTRTLIIFGASAVAISLVPFAKTAGFRTVVVDGRERFATRERFPNADEIRIGISSEIAGELTLGPNTPIVLVAHDYKIDLPVLTRALAAETPYIGLLGSRRRGAAILQLLRDQGIAEEQLRRVRVPIGLDLGGESASDIALAIIAEVVAVLHGRNGSALCTAS